MSSCTITPETGLFDLEREDEIVELFTDNNFNCYVEYCGTQFYIVFDEMMVGVHDDEIALLTELEDSLN